MGRNTTAPVAEKEPKVAAAGGSAAPVPAVDRLKSQLHEKDQLVAALTERLEQAAEQLDRLRRTGADKGRRPLSGDSAATLSGEQKATFEDLKRVIGTWEETQPGEALGRIETKINELRALVSGALPSGAAVTVHAAASRERAAAPPAATASTAQPADKAPAGSWWERQKAAMLGDPPPPEGAQDEAPAPADQPADPAAASEPAPGPRPEFNLGEAQIPEPPPPVDFETLTLDDARAAIRERDGIIEKLREPLLLMQAAGQLPADLESLDHLPEALRRRIQELEAQWQAKFRQSELDLSLERARLARDESQLRQQHELVQKQLKQGGRHQKRPGDDGDGDEGAAKRRWFRFMGKPGEEPADASNGETR